MSTFGVVLFHTTSSAMRAEKILKQANRAVKLIPTPREFSSDCGIALRFDWCEALQIKILLEQARVEVAGIHPLG